MKRELDEQLVKDHPTLFADRHASMTTTAMCWGFECGDGWYGLLKEACDKIEPILAKCKKDNPKGWEYGYYRASQIKEKFGTLRFYMSGAPEEVEDIIDEATIKSAKTCEDCGKPGKFRDDGWCSTRCDTCYDKLRKPNDTI
jgi:hypothetical protein